MVITKLGIVAASQSPAAQAGAQILAEGSSAADAAIAANATLGVVEPMMNGMGGDLLTMAWNAKTGKLSGLNSSGPTCRGLWHLSPLDCSWFPGGCRLKSATGAREGAVPTAISGGFGLFNWRPDDWRSDSPKLC